MFQPIPFERQTLVIKLLAEGMSIRAIERATETHRDTVMRLGVRVGKACDKLMDDSMRGLSCKRLEVDEIWGFVGKKQGHVLNQEEYEKGMGNQWTFVALDADTKLVPSFKVGRRDKATTQLFTDDLSSRLRDKVMLSTDGMNSYLECIPESFSGEVDYAQIVKVYASGHNNADKPMTQRRYSPPPIIGVTKRRVWGEADLKKASTSHVEKQNHTMRMHIRRLARLTNAFSKKVENLQAAVALHFAYYNFVKINGAIRCTPAMEAGVTQRIWRVEDLVERAAA